MPDRWPYQTPGIPDSEFDRIPGIPLTPREVRVLLLSQLRLASKECLWDIGAGTGTIAVEAGLLCPKSKIVAIERDEEVVELIERNCQKFGVANVEVIQGTAPDCLSDIETSPSRICIEGGRDIRSLVEASWSFLNTAGRIIATAGSLETLYALSESLSQVRARHIEVIQPTVNRLESKAFGQPFISLDPIFILSGEKVE